MSRFAARLWLAGVAVVTVAVYAPAWTTSTAFSDDYPLLTSAIAGDGSVSRHVLSGGRPIYAWVLDVSFRLAGSIDGLQALRALGTLGVAAVAVVAFVALLRTGLGAPGAAGLAVAVALLPTFQTFAAWATAWPFGWACAAAGVGSLVLHRWLEDDRRGWWRPVVAVVAVTVALLVYQPAAMFVWFPLAADLALRVPGWPEVRRAVTAHVVVAGTGIIVGLGLSRLVMAVADVDPLSRAALVTPGDLPSKLTWFVSRPIVLGLRPFIVASPEGVEAALWAIPVVVPVALGLLVLVRRRRALPALAALAVLVPLSALPNLVTAENQIEFRILAGLAPTMLVILAAGGRALIEELPRGADRVGPVALFGVVTVAAVLAVVNTTSLFVDPPQATIAFFEDELAGFDPDRDDLIAVVVPNEGWGAHANVGIWSVTSDLTHSWVPQPLTQLVLAERGIEWRYEDVALVRDRDDVPDGAFVIDTEPLRRRFGPQ